MKKNIGIFDKVFRIIIGLAILILGIIYNSWLGLIGLVPIVTALLGRCPAYSPFGISTCKAKETKNNGK
ncbi:DUF2892 domain-containing protein [candidate division KSB1 bacterium]|nr:DUF2892 domain-containing protein [candidate division KSB1 bacterium]MBL7092462.1 DUF2892 domain-containing protein [candidate division KSB1 bacterium]